MPEAWMPVPGYEGLYEVSDGSARKTHCPQGHPYSGDNLSTRPNGDRRCRACHRDQQRAYRRLAAHEERDQS